MGQGYWGSRPANWNIFIVRYVKMMLTWISSTYMEDKAVKHGTSLHFVFHCFIVLLFLNEMVVFSFLLTSINSTSKNSSKHSAVDALEVVDAYARFVACNNMQLSYCCPPEHYISCGLALLSSSVYFFKET